MSIKFVFTDDSENETDIHKVSLEEKYNKDILKLLEISSSNSMYLLWDSQEAPTYLKESTLGCGNVRRFSLYSSKLKNLNLLDEIVNYSIGFMEYEVIMDEKESIGYCRAYWK